MEIEDPIDLDLVGDTRNIVEVVDPESLELHVADHL
jgi:hypothetical protein